MSIKDKLSSKNGKFASNTVFLFLLTFSNYLFNFITFPYQTRVLGPEIFGNIGFATSVMTYVQLVLEFGFLLSATEDIAKSRENNKIVSKIFTSVMWCKTILVFVCAVVMVILCTFVDRFQEDPLLFYLYFIAYAIFAFIPDFLYRGIENMKVITVRSVLIKMFSTVMIFIFLKEASQYYLVPIFTGVGNLGAVIFVLLHVRKMGYGFVKVTPGDVFKTLKRSAYYFLSRVASAVYTATNTLILGFALGSSSALVGYYSTAEKGISVAKQAITPVTDSLYPHMVKHRNFSLVKKLLLLGMPVLLVGCSVVMIVANPLCAFVFGEEYYQAGDYLRLLAPVVFFSYPATIFGFPMLTPMGLAKHANRSVICGAILQLSMIAVIYFIWGISPEKICIATCITEIFTCAYRVIIVVKNRHLMQADVTE